MAQKLGKSAGGCGFESRRVHVKYKCPVCNGTAQTCTCSDATYTVKEKSK